MMDNKEEIIENLKDRSEFYRLLSSLYFKPLTQAQIDAFAEIDWEGYGDINDDFAKGAHHIARQLKHRHSGTRELLAADFTKSLGGTSTYEEKTAVPYESVFATGSFMHGPYMDVYKAYKAENIRRKENFDYPEDHISFMFQFEAMMGDRAAQALNDGDAEKAVHDLDVALKFKEEHIDNWIGDLEELVCKLVEERFYKGVLLITKGFLTMDGEELEGMLAELRAE